MRPLACKLTQELELSKYQPTYDSNTAKIEPLSHDVVDLTPPRRKHTFAPGLNLSLSFNDEAIFEALTNID